jgi:trehalose 6-phosphate synthase/phosphatase
MKIVVGRDKLDVIQGVRHKLLALQIFLEKYPEVQQKVVLIQVGLQPTATDLAGSIANIGTHVNSRFSTVTCQPVVFLPTQDLTFSQYLTLLTVADVFLVTSLRESSARRGAIASSEQVHRLAQLQWLPFLHRNQPGGQARDRLCNQPGTDDE